LAKILIIFFPHPWLSARIPGSSAAVSCSRVSPGRAVRMMNRYVNISNLLSFMSIIEKPELKKRVMDASRHWTLAETPTG